MAPRTRRNSFTTGLLPAAVTSATGTVQASYTFEPFGATTATGPLSPNEFQFTGRENDGTGLYDYRARYYNPGIHRFISEDPTGLDGGDVNLFAYVQNRPTDLTDPLGLSACEPLCFAQLKYRPATADGAMNHAFWYVQGSDGRPQILSGGKADAGGVGVWVTPADPGDSRLLAPTSWSIGPSAEVCEAVDKMIKAAQDWPKQGIGKYWWEGPNSNSAAKYLGSVGGFAPGAPPLTKGWDVPLPRRQ